MKRTAPILALLLAALLSPIEARSQEARDTLRRQCLGLKREVSFLTGMPFKNEVDIHFFTKAQVLKFLREELDREFPKDRARRSEKAYAHFGLIPDDCNLYQALLTLYSEAASGFYHPRTKRMILIHPLPPGVRGGNPGLDMLSITMVHELGHAAQDQNFDLVTLPLEESTNDDLVAALRSLVEGEASTLGWMYGFKDDFDRYINVINNSYKAANLPGEAGKIDLFIRHMLVFPYGYGCDFVLEVKKAGGGNWGPITRMHADPPLSTEQILHPEKYWKQRDNPTEITLPELGSDWKPIENNVHGEFTIRFMLAKLKGASRSEAAKAAEGWDGDRYHVFDKDGRVSSVWYTYWDSAEDAEQFFSAYRRALAAKHPDARGDAGDETRVRWDAGDGRAILLERRETDVLAIEGDPSLVAKAAAVWKGATKQEFTKVERYRRGKWACPDHPEVVREVNTRCPKCAKHLVEAR